MPCLAATQADLLTEATRPCTEAMLMMRPHFLSFMPGSAALMVWKLELKLRAMILSQLSSGKSSTLSTCWMPALLTRMSTRPKCEMLFSMRDLQSACLNRSAWMNLADRLPTVNSFSSLVISSWEAKPFNTMLEPAADRAFAMPRPMPLREPVTTAVFPTKN